MDLLINAATVVSGGVVQYVVSCLALQLSR